MKFLSVFFLSVGPTQTNIYIKNSCGRLSISQFYQSQNLLYEKIYAAAWKLLLFNIEKTGVVLVNRVTVHGTMIMQSHSKWNSRE